MEYATIEGTASYQNLKNIENFHFKRSEYTSGLTLTSLGMGTYLGNIDKNTDELVRKAIKTSLLSGGINIIDTAINYRYQKAERSIGRALEELFLQKLLKREQIFVSTKNGYIPGDADQKLDPKSYYQKYLKELSLDSSAIVDGNHSMDPKFLEHQLHQSLMNLRLKTIDLLYLHNSAESELQLGMKEYLNRLQKSFSFLEDMRSENKIRFYGLATWNCFRVSLSNKKEHLNLQDVYDVAKEVGGKNNGFKFIQLPINLLMNESFTKKWQLLNGEKVSLMDASDKLKIGVFGSVPLYQTRLFSKKVPSFSGLSSKSQKLLQFVRSIPHKSIIAPLVGHKNPVHVEDNLGLMFEPPVYEEAFNSYIQDLP